MELAQFNNSSPFDSIKREEGGREFWSARDLMPLMGYARWGEFKTPVDRAMKSAANQGHDVDGNFRGSAKVSGTRGPAQQDYELSRFAAYLVAMNGDPNKSEVAAAQSYFAIRTREAETAPAIEIPRTLPEALRAYAREVEAREAMEAYARELEPKGEAYDSFISGDGTYSVGNVAKMLGLSQNKLYARLRSEGVMIAKGAMRNTPYQKYMHHFAVKAYDYTRSDGTVGTSYTTRVQPTGVDFIRRRFGLIVQDELVH